MGLSVAGLHPASLPDLGPAAIADDSTIGEVAYAVLRKHLGSLLAHEPGTRLGDDPEELHDMRVATRRLRAALILFSDVLPQRAQRVREELRWLAQALGEVRDLDVQLDQLSEWRHETTKRQRQEDFAPLQTVLERHRHEARQRMLGVLDSDRYRKLLGSITSMVVRGPVSVIEAGRVPVVEAAPDLLKKRHRRFRKAGDAITADSPSEDYHDLRKRGKRLRYALEFLGDVYGKSTKGMIAPLTELQDLLGEHQDAYVAVARLRELSATEGSQLPSTTVFSMGEISQRYAQQTAKLRAKFPAAYEELEGRRWRQFRRSMKVGRS
ncbi:MAG: CHAD domain-containing protein [Chloroflexota bacterium]|nr:CHAD domain-containing protein [Chloroflexota bacterium]